MISINGFMLLPKAQRRFVSDYLDTISTFQEKLEMYRGAKDNLPIQNMDLWIESYIDIIPELQEFRDYVHSQMEKRGIERHPGYTYWKENNHYYYSNKRDIEELRESLKLNEYE